MNLFEIKEICKDEKSAIEYLQGQKILHREVQCVPGQHACSLIKESTRSCSYITYMWRCSKCRKKQTVLKDSFLKGQHLLPTKFVYLIYFWSAKTPMDGTGRDSESHRHFVENCGRLLPVF